MKTISQLTAGLFLLLATDALSAATTIRGLGQNSSTYSVVPTNLNSLMASNIYAKQKLGISNASPTYALDVSGVGRFTDGVILSGTGASGYPLLVSGQIRLGSGAPFSLPFDFREGSSGMSGFYFNSDGSFSVFSGSTTATLLGQTNRSIAFRAATVTNTPPAGHAAFFAATNSGAIEMFVIDSAGNVTQLSSHPGDAPPEFFITTNWITGPPRIEKTAKLFAGRIEWDNTSLRSLLEQWRVDSELIGSNYLSSLSGDQQNAIRSGIHRDETFAAYNARMNFGPGDSRALVAQSWEANEAKRQLDYDTARTNEILRKLADPKVVVRPLADVRQSKPALVDSAAFLLSK